jgi:elongation factor Tu
MKRIPLCLILVFVVVSIVMAACGSAATAERTGTLEPIPAPQEASNQPFLMRIENVFVIKGRGTVVAGRVARGTVQVGDAVEIIDSGDRALKTVVTGVEMFQKTVAQAVAGDNVGILLRGIEADEVLPGMVLARAGAFTSYAEALRNLE